MTWIRVVVDVALALWWARLVVTVAGRPARRWRTGWFGKSVSLLAALMLVSFWLGWVLPYGAVIVWWRVLLRSGDSFELPMADGRPMR